MKTQNRFEHLMSPGRIGSVVIGNRIIKTGAGSFLWNEQETAMNKVILAFYESLARGGVGLLIVESPIVDYPKGARWRDRYRIDDDKYIKGLSALPEIIHKYGCPTFMQMNHDGPWQSIIGITTDPPFTGTPVAASPVMIENPNDFHNQMPRALTIEEIEEIIDKFATAAVRAEKAGFDGVEINAASSHLLHNFFSPYFNRRTDIYGGTSENRARFTTSIIKEIKKRVGMDFPVSVCMNGLELGRLAGIDDSRCLTAEEARQIAILLQQAGADSIHVRSHWLGYHVGSYLTDLFFYPEPPIPVKSIPEEYDATRSGAAANSRLSHEMKKVLDIPVIVVGKFDAELGEQILKDGKADFIGMTRRLQADPDYPRKIKESRLDDIAPCTSCENCLGTKRCRINAFLGKEYNRIDPAEKKKKVVIVGGGPAGMEAARVSALRGHDVAIYEKSRRFGGLIPIAAVVKGTDLENLPLIVQYLGGQLKKLGVTTRLGTEFNSSTIEKENPDTVIIATGGVTKLPDIPGIENKCVISMAKLHGRLKKFVNLAGAKNLHTLTRFWMPVGKRVVIIGSGLQGCELAEFLTKRKRKVTVIDTADDPGKGMIDVLLAYLMLWFKNKGVRIANGISDLKILKDGVEFTTRDGRKDKITAESVIPAFPLSSELNLIKELENKVPEIYAIGDCKEPLLIADAIGAGLRIARNI